MLNYSMRVSNAAKTNLEVFIYDIVGATWWGEGVSANQFRKDLREAGDKIENINVRVNSPGGDVSDGLAIHNLLRDHKARVEVDIDGYALSIASIIAVAGDEVRMAHNAMFMIHDPWGGVIGNADQLRKEAEVMDKHKITLVNTYERRTGLPREDIEAAMSAETWYTAAEAAEAGFVDKVTDGVQVVACGGMGRFSFKNVPPHFLAAVNRTATPNSNRAAVIAAQMQQRLQTA